MANFVSQRDKKPRKIKREAKKEKNKKYNFIRKNGRFTERKRD